MSFPAAGMKSGMDADRSEFADLFKQVRILCKLC